MSNTELRALEGLVKCKKKEYGTVWCFIPLQNATEWNGSPLMPPKKKEKPATVPHPLGTEIYTTEEVAQSLKLSVRFILQAIKNGQLEARQTGKQYLITREAVQKFWESLPLVVKKR